MINRDILNYICCPRCKGKLTRMNGFLVCKNCKRKYKIIKDIPVLVNLKRLEKHHRKQILYFEREAETKPSYVLEEWQKSYLRRFDRSVRLLADDVIADIGTGDGYMAIELAKRGNVVLACDLNLKGLVKLKKVSERLNLTKNLLLFVCSAEELPIKSDTVDVFISNAVLEHIPKEKKAIKEVRRICKKTAYGFVTVPLDLEYICPPLWLINIIHDKRIGHLRRYSRESLRDKFHGWNLVKVYYTGHFKKVVKVLVNNMLAKLFDDRQIEREDELRENQKWGASNICVIFSRHS